MEFTETIEIVGKTLDAVGVGAIVIGVLWAAISTARLSGADGSTRYRTFRSRLGQAILLGLELLVAADIIRTVAISPTFASAGVLALIVLIRTFLSWSLELEITGRWPWQQTKTFDAPAAKE